MISSKRLVLACDDSRLTTGIHSQLSEALGVDALRCTLQTVREHVGAHSDVVIGLAGPQDVEPVRLLVHEIRLLRAAAPIVVLDPSAVNLRPALAPIEPYLLRLLNWPGDAEELGRLARERAGRLRGFPASGDETINDIIHRRLAGSTPSLLPLLERIALAAMHDVTVLLTGETGTGKTYLARLMHDCSPRRREPFLAVPCGAQPANLLESLFFGHVKGAFTGADRTREGKFAAAGRGTILLDEIDTLPLEAQASLLRVIETGEYEPVGSNATQHCEARIVVASNWDLEEATRQGRFRPDLYYRLNVMSFHLPPLRERVEDLGPLVRGLAARFNTKFRKHLVDIGHDAMAALENFDWPGNLRQLENFVQQAVLVSKGTVLQKSDLPPLVLNGHANSNGHIYGVGVPQPNGDSLLRHRDIARDNAERVLIVRALQAHEYNRTRTAKSLGISRVTLFKKMKKYGLSEPARP